MPWLANPIDRWSLDDWKNRKESPSSLLSQLPWPIAETTARFCLAFIIEIDIRAIASHQHGDTTYQGQSRYIKGRRNRIAGLGQFTWYRFCLGQDDASHCC
jgi:hypothetical protein